jgi:hypothetical protein
VAPGTYIVSGSAGSESRGVTTITVVRDRDYPGARITLWPSQEIAGSMIAEAGATLDLHLTRVSLTSFEPAIPSPVPAAVRPDRGFSLNAVPAGTYALSVSGLPGDVYIKGSRYGQTFVADGSVELVGGAAPQSLQVLLGSDGGQIVGSVLNSSGQPRSGAQLVLVPNGDRRGRPEQYKLAKSDETGAFTIRAVPPGDYKIFAWEVLEPYAYLNADFMRIYEELGQPVHVDSNARIPTQVRMIPAEN